MKIHTAAARLMPLIMMVMITGGMAWAQSDNNSKPPPVPVVLPQIGKKYPNDVNGDRLDDQLAVKMLQAVQARAAAPNANAEKLTQAVLDAKVEVELIFEAQVTQKQIDDFVAQGGEITYMYKAVSFGWNGRIPLDKVAGLPALLGASLVMVEESKPMQLHMETATRTGRIRPVWAAGFAGNPSGFDGDSTITIGVLDTGVDESHPDLNGRRVFWQDFSADALSSPADLGQHGTHVASIATGSGVATGTAAGTLKWTDNNDHEADPSGFYPSPVDLPATSLTVTFTATWSDGGNGTLGLAYLNKGTNSFTLQTASATGPSPLTFTHTFTPLTTRAYTAYFPANGVINKYVVSCQATNHPASSDAFNKFRGVAPGCNWAGAKVFTNAGSGTSLAISSAIDTLVANRSLHNIKVMNLSLGTIGNPGLNTSHRQKVNTAVNNGIVVVASAGNDGPTQQVDDPGRAAMVLTVASSNDANTLTNYTSQGFSTPGATAGQEEDFKPDLMAPGGSTGYHSGIMAADSNTADEAFPDQQANDHYNIQGTSMAAPFAAGCAALVIDAIQQSGVTWDFASSQHSRLVKMLLCATASESNAIRESNTGNPTLQRAAAGPNSFPDSKDQYEGYGMINPDAAIEAVTVAYTVGGSTSGMLGSLTFDRRVWARKVALTAGQVFSPTITVPAGADYDMYLYSSTPSNFGAPVRLASSTTAGTGGTETFSHTAASTANMILVVKRISGSGTFNLTSPGTPALAGIEGINLGYTENQAATAITSTMTVSDPDSANLTSGSVSLSAGFASGQDVLAMSPNPQNGITASYSSGTGVLSLSGSSTLANYQAALRAVTYANSSDAPSTATRTATFLVSDGTSSATTSRNITVTAVNDAPLASNLSAAESYTEDTTLNLTNIVVTDPDSANVTATLTLSNTSAGSLTTATSGAVTSTFASGIWTASGALADVNTLLAGVSFTPASNFNSGFTINTSVSDGVAAAVTGSKTMTTTPTNDAPVLSTAATPVLAAVNEDAPAPSGAVGTLVSALVDFASPAGQLDNVTDVDSGALLGIAITAADAANGTWFYSINGGTNWQALGTPSGAASRLLAADAQTRLYFQPSLNFNGTVATAVTFRAWDQTSGTNGSTAATTTNGGTTAFSAATDTASLIVNPVNDPPQATNLAAAETYTEDTTLNLTDIVVTDVDGGNVTATLTLSDTAAGSLTTATSGAVTSTFAAGVWSASGAIADVNVLLAGVSYAPAANYLTAFNIATSVSDGVAAPVTGSKAMTATPTNDAPVLSAAASPVLAAVNEDAAVPSGVVGTLVSALVDFATPAGQLDNVTDVDSGALLGIAITAADAANGTWHYSINGGTNWNVLGTPTGAASRLLAANAQTRLYFQPNANFDGTVATAITFRAWDQTSGTNGGTAATTTNGGLTAFSIATDTASQSVTGSNDAPVLSAAATPVLAAVAEGAPAPSGAVGTLVSALVDFASPAGQLDNVTDSDGGALLGIAITAADATNGTWHYSINGGTSWQALGTPTGAASRLLAADAQTRLYFQPAADFNGSVATAITFRAWDQTSGANGSTAATTTNGGLTAFSTVTDTASQSVTPLNDAPVLNPAAAPVLASVAEDAVAPAGAVGTLVSGLVDFASPAGQLDNVTDVDSGALLGIAITAADASNGVWHYSINGGTNWLALGTPTGAASRLLAADAQTRLYFQPGADFNGTVASAITFRAWDQTSGTNGGTAATTTNGGLTAFSTATDAAGITVTPLNDLPVVTPTVAGLAYLENQAATVVDAGLVLNDVDNASLTGGSVAITTGFASAQDTLAFVNQGGITGSYSSGTGVLTLSGTASVGTYQTALRSVTYANSSDTPTAARTITFTINDGTGNGAGTRGITITPVNDAPTLDVIADRTPIPPNSGMQTVNLSGISAGGGESQTLTVTITGNTNPTLIPSPAVNYTSANATGSITYTPAASTSGTCTLTVQVGDNGGTANGGVNVTTRSFLITVGNGAPVVTTTPAPLAYTENDSATLIDPALTVTDFDDANLVGATVAVTANFSSGQDVLGFTNQGGITGSYNAGTGVLTLTGTASLATYQTALRTVTYLNSSNNPTTSARTLTFTCNDGDASNNLGSSARNITVTAVNDPPVLLATPSSLNYLENQAATAIDTNLLASDDDSATFTGATVAITGNFASGQDVLGFTDQAGITGSYNAGTGVLTLSGTAGSGAYQAALASVTYANTSDTPSTLQRTVTFTANDGASANNLGTVTRTINITAVNDAPTLAAIGNPAAILEDAAQQTVNISGIAAGGGETQVLSVSATSDNTALIPHPTVTYTSADATGSLAYTPVANANGTATITVTVTDDGGTANGGINPTTRTFTVLVTSVNDAPTLAAISNPAAILEDAAQQTVNLSGIAAGGGEVQVLSVNATSDNTALIPNPTATYTSANATGSLAYTPVANASGSAVVTVTVTDNGGTTNGGINTTTRTFTVNVTAVNDAPTLAVIGNPAAILEDAAQQTVNLSGIASGGGEVQVLSVSATSDNTALIPNPTTTYTSANATGSLAYTPVANASGSAVITVTVTDDGGTANGGINTTTGTFTVSVTSVNDAPTLAAISNPAAILEDAAQQTVNLSGIAAGAGEVQVLSVNATSDNTALIPNPTVTYTSANPTGSLAYTPVAYASGSATITVTVTDDGGTANGGINTTTRTFTVTVTAVNDAPTLAAIGNPAAILEDASQQTVSLSGITAGGGEVQVLGVTASSDNTALIPNPTVTYTSANATGSLAYTPVANASGSAVVTVTVTDNGGTANGGVNTTTRTFTVNVTAVNDAPTLAAISNPESILEDATQQTVSLSGISAGGGEVQVLSVSATSDNTALIPNPTTTYASANATGSLAYTPVANASGSATITVTVTDDGGTANGGINTTTRTFIVTVTAVNDAPTLAAIGNPAAILEDATQQTVNLSGIGAGGGEVQVLSVSATSDNTALIPHPTTTYTSANATGSLAYTPVANANGSAVITVTVTDNGGTINGGINVTTRTFTVNVTAVNDVPTLAVISNPATILEDAAQQAVNLTGIAAGGGEVQVLSVNATSDNTALIPNPTVTYTSAGATGALSYTPVANANGSATITVTVTDDGGTANGGINTTTRTFVVTVTAVNDAPTLAAIGSPAAILEDAVQQTVNLSGIAAGGGEIQTLTVTAASDNTALIPHPTVSYTSANATGSLAYKPVADANGSATITVTVQDSGGTASGGVDLVTRTFVVTVTSVNDQPTLAVIADPAAILEDAAQQVVNLTGISAGGGEIQTLSISANSDNTALIPNPSVTYTSASATGSLSYTPVTNANGSATLTVTVEDDGGTANGGVNTRTLTFVVTVTSVNDAPVIAAIPSPAAVLEDSAPQTLSFTGVAAGGSETQMLTVTATSDNPDLIPHPSVTYASADTGGSLSYTPVTDAFGSATITVTLRDDGGTAGGGDDETQITFTVQITPVNDQPVLALIPNPAPIIQDDPQQTVALAGISAGPKETQVITISAASSNPALIPDPAVAYTSAGASGSLAYTPVPGASGSAVITVTVQDDGGTTDGGLDLITRTFTVVVYAPVVITVPPAAQTLNPGAAAHFAVTATGTQPITYQWRKGGDPIPGATDDHYDIPAVIEEDEGSYDVIVSNVVGPKTSTAALLKVNDPVVITSEPQPVTLNLGERADFAVAVTGTAPITFQWRKNGDAIPGAQDSSYFIPAALVSDEGLYDVEITNIVGMKRSVAVQLTVLRGTPRIIRQPASQIVALETAVSLSVQVGGTAPFSFQWKKGSTSIPGATSATYHIPATQSTDTAAYTVVVKNALGSITSDKAQITVMNAAVYEFTTTAGKAGTKGSTDGTGAAALLSAPDQGVRDSLGNLFVTDRGNHSIRKITPAGAVSLFAGLPGTSGSTDGTGNAARFSAPAGIGIDPADNLYVADSGNHTIRKITPAGVVTTFAGAAGSPGAVDDMGALARFRSPLGVTVDADSHVFVADSGNHTLREIAPDGTVSTLAGLAGQAGKTDGAGPLARFSTPAGIAVGATGLLHVADERNHCIRRVTPDGLVSTLAGLGGTSGAKDGLGSIARFNLPDGVGVDAGGNVFVSEAGNHAIRLITPAGRVSTIGGKAPTPGSTNGVGANARFKGARGMIVESQGTIHVMDSGNHTLRKGVLIGLPQIDTAPVSRLVGIGQTVNFTVAASGGAPLTFQWSKNGAAIKGATGASFTLNAATLKDAGTYAVTVKNGAGAVTSTGARLGVVSLAASTVIVNETAATSLTASAAGDNLIYEWQKSGRPLAPAPQLTGITTAKLGIKPATITDAGAYTCSVRLGSLRLETSVYTLLVRQKPVLLSFNPLPWIVSGTVPDRILVMDNSMLNAPTSYSVAGLPPGMIFDTRTGQLGGKPNKAGTHMLTITATNAAGKSTALVVQITVLDLPAKAVGTFNGLVDRDTGLSAPASTPPNQKLKGLGGALNLVTTLSGGVTGTLRLEDKSYPLTGRLDAQGAAGNPTCQLTLARGKGIASLVLNLLIHAATGEVTGTLTDGVTAAPVVVQGWRNPWLVSTKPALHNPASHLAGTYTAAMEIASAALVGDPIYPQGTGFGTLVITLDGKATWTGPLADGVVVTASTTVGPNGEIPLHWMLYKNLGSARGWLRASAGPNSQIPGDNMLDTMLDLSQTDPEEQPMFDWVKLHHLPGDTSTSYKEGFPLHKLVVTGGGYVKPANGVIGLLGLPEVPQNAEIILEEGGIESAVSFAGPGTRLTINAQDKVVMSGTNPMAVTFTTLNATTGAFSGNFSLVGDPDPTKPGALLNRSKVPFTGIIVPRLGQGVGQFQLAELPSFGPPQTNLTTSQRRSGNVLLKVAP